MDAHVPDRWLLLQHLEGGEHRGRLHHRPGRLHRLAELPGPQLQHARPQLHHHGLSAGIYSWKYLQLVLDERLRRLPQQRHTTAGPHQHAHTDANANADTFAVTDQDALTNTHIHADTNTNRHPLAVTDQDAVPNTHLYADTYTDANRNPLAVTDQDPLPHTHPNAFAVTHPNAFAGTYHYPHTITDAGPTDAIARRHVQSNVVSHSDANSNCCAHADSHTYSYAEPPAHTHTTIRRRPSAGLYPTSDSHA